MADTAAIVRGPGHGSNGPISALSSIRCLDWLLLPGIPVRLTDQVAVEATRNPDLLWTGETCEWIARNVIEERLKISVRCAGANDLDAFIARRPVSCLPISLDRYGRTVATCLVGGVDLGDWLVRNGLALDWPEYSKRKYDATQREAEEAGRGIWKGSYVEPWLYRVCIRARRQPSRLF